MLKTKSLISWLQKDCQKSLATHFSPHGDKFMGKYCFIILNYISLLKYRDITDKCKATINTILVAFFT